MFINPLKCSEFKPLTSFFIVSIVVISRLLGLLQPLELFYFDLLLKIRKSETQDDRIILVEIGSDDIPLADSNSSKISARDLANAITQIQEHEPAVIGLNVLTDLIENSENSIRDLSDFIEKQDNIIVAETLLPPFIYPLPRINSSKVGFVDLLPDQDQYIRRMLLGAEDFQQEDVFKFSFSLLLAKYYLEERGHTLENGLSDNQAMRFDNVEIPRTYSNTGGYSRLHQGGVQTIVNYRKSDLPFQTIQLKDIQNNSLDSYKLHNRIVIIGVTDPSKRARADTPIKVEMHGLDITAHFTSQIVSAVLDNRLLIKTWEDIYEYILIVAFGSFIVWVSCQKISILSLFSIHFSTAFFTSLIAYIYFSIYGYWIVLAPLILILFLNFLLHILVKAYALASKNEILNTQNEIRREVIERTFSRLHNGPLQEISIILNTLRNTPTNISEAIDKLEELSEDIREIGGSLEEESGIDDKILYLRNGERLDLSHRLHELFYQVYSKTLNRDFANFRELKIKIRSFDQIPLKTINLDNKRELCRYLEEALCNVGKHGANVTELRVLGRSSEGLYTLEIRDNGWPKSQSNKEGEGTKQAKRLAQKLRGEFDRHYESEKGTICKLRWPLKSNGYSINIFSQ